MPDVNADGPDDPTGKTAGDDGGRRIALNRSERVYLALEGVAGAIAQTHVLRFATPHSVDDLRTASRALIRTTPRLRTRIARDWRGWHLLVRADGPEIDAAFASAFCPLPAGDLEPHLHALVNHPFDLHRDLPLRVRVFTDGPNPTVVLSLHHTAGDGRAMMELVASFLSLLNGRKPAPLALDPPSMIPALLPPRGNPFTILANLWRSFWLHRRGRQKRQSLRPLTSQAPSPFGPTAHRLHTSRLPLTAIKRLADRHGASITEIVVAALAQAFAADARPSAERAVVARLSLDLRPHFPASRRPRFGNYVASFLVQLPHWNDFNATVRDTQQQIRLFVARFADKAMSYPLLLAELTPRLLGRTLLARTARILKQRGGLEPITFHFSNLGNLDHLNRIGTHACLAQLHFFSPAVGPYVGCTGLNNRLSLALSYPSTELTASEIDAALDAFDAVLSDQLSVSQPSPPQSASQLR